MFPSSGVFSGYGGGIPGEQPFGLLNPATLLASMLGAAAGGPPSIEFGGPIGGGGEVRLRSRRECAHGLLREKGYSIPSKARPSTYRSHHESRPYLITRRSARRSARATPPAALLRIYTAAREQPRATLNVARRFPINIIETTNAYEISADLPGARTRFLCRLREPGPIDLPARWTQA